MRTRFASAMSGAVVAFAVTTALFNGAPGAIATQGQAVIAGQVNTETAGTVLENTTHTDLFTVCPNPGSNADDGLAACGNDAIMAFGDHIGLRAHARDIAVRANGLFTGVLADGVNFGVRAQSSHTAVFGFHQGDEGIGVWGQTNGTGSGVYGEAIAPGIGVGVVGESLGNGGTGIRGRAGNGGTGVFGTHTGATGVGVHGRTAGTGAAVFGEATANGAGVFGQSSSGPGVVATSTGGDALDVRGKAKFSRSGTVTISYPNKTATVSGVPVTAKSLAFATLQQFLAGRYVLAVVPNLSGSSNSFTIYLNRAPGTSTTPKSVVVGWHVIEKP